MKTEFKVGDIVTAFGLEGVVESVSDIYKFAYPVYVKFSTGYSEEFTVDGLSQTWHKEPSLKLVRRAEEFEEVVGYFGVYMSEKELPWTPVFIYKTKEDVLKQSDAIGYREVKYMRRKV